MTLDGSGQLGDMPNLYFPKNSKSYVIKIKITSTKESACALR